MMNAFSRMGRTCAFLAVAGGLMAGALMARVGDVVTVELPHAVSVGSTMLPAGEYTISGIDMGNGDQLFVVRSQNRKVATLQGQKITSTQAADKTEVVFSAEGDAWRFDKLFIQGDNDGFEFVNGK